MRYKGTRHSLASQAANRGISEAIIEEMLSHKDPKSTKTIRATTEPAYLGWYGQQRKKTKEKKWKIFSGDKKRYSGGTAVRQVLSIKHDDFIRKS